MAEEACRAGVRWVQLRIKNGTDEQVLEEAKKTKIICQKYGAKLIINDHVNVAKLVEAEGVHLGKKDMSPKDARKILGKEFIIGGTANTLEDIINLQDQGVDYVGLGPYRFTQTKKNLSSVLGEKGYQNILEKLKEKSIDIPVIAIGGIQIDDIKTLMNIGVYGIAVASLINEANEKMDVVEKIDNAFNHGEITHSR